MLDDAAEETLPSVIDVDAILKSTKKIDELKPWLAFSSNVPPVIRDKWTKMVKTDALAKRSVSTGGFRGSSSASRNSILTQFHALFLNIID